MDMNALINIDKVNEVVQNTHIKKNPCNLFISDENAVLQSAMAANKNSASDTEVFLSNFFLPNESVLVGLAMKMWIDWPSVSKERLKEVLANIEETLSKNFVKLQEISALLTQANLPNIENPNYAVTAQAQFNKFTDNALYLSTKIKKYKGKFFQTKHLLEKLIKKKEELDRLQEKIAVLTQILDLEHNFHPVRTNVILSDLKIIITDSIKKFNKYEGLDYEKCVYKFITDKIILTNISPNFIPLVSSASCSLSNILPSLPFDPKDKRLIKLKRVEEFFPLIPVKFFVTGTTPNNSLFSFDDAMFQIDTTSPYDFKPILFQIIYSLSVMDHFGIVHNDLHFKNIFVQDLGEPYILKFNLENFSLQIKTKYIIKIFDWDRAYVESLGPNKLLTNYAYSHQINKKRSKQDFYQILCILKKFPQIWKIVKLTLQNVPDNFDYEFKDDKTIEQQRLNIQNNSQLREYMANNMDKWTLDAQGIYWVEMDVVYLSKMTKGDIILNKFSQIYAPKRYEDMEDIYLGFQFYNKEEDTDIDNDYLTGQYVTVRFSPGWRCQSLFNVKDSVLPPAKFFLLSRGFLRQMYDEDNDQYRSDAEYTFPKLPFVPGKTSPCQF
uniref:Protein kinase domain-containing protein n=1 Tax=viral metagenome TaxID=1070528 RepID=A0A6C0KTP9_9ZZZZ